MTSTILVTCSCGGNHQKKAKIASDTNLADLKGVVKNSKLDCLPHDVKLLMNTGDDWKVLEDGLLRVEDKSRIKVATYATIQLLCGDREIVELDVELSIELSELYKKIEEKTHYPEVALETFDPEFEEWLSVQNTGDLSIYEGAKVKVSGEEVFCATMSMYSKKYRAAEPQQIASWVHTKNLWKQESALTVFFLNRCPVTNNNIVLLEVQDVWRHHGEDCFKEGISAEKSDIRVKYEEGFGGSWSRIGSTAQFVEKSEATMIIRWSKTMKSKDLMPIIIHQFGHALGFGHVVMKQSEWNVLKAGEFVDSSKMMESYGTDSADNFEVMWTGKGMPESDINCSDDKSVMQFSTSKSWLKEKFRDKEKVQVELKLGGTESTALINFHNHLSPRNMVLSSADKQTLQRIVAPSETGLPNSVLRNPEPPSPPPSPGSHKIRATYQGKKCPAMNDLAFMKLHGEKFRLLSQISARYKEVANVLKLEQHQKDRIEHEEEYGSRITAVFKHWDQNARGLAGGYPHTWQGLWEILDDSGLTEKGTAFFDFLEKHE